MTRLQTYLSNLCRQMDIQNAPKSCVVQFPINERELNIQLKESYSYMLWGKDKDGFEGTVIQYNDRKFYFLDALIDY